MGLLTAACVFLGLVPDGVPDAARTRSRSSSSASRSPAYLSRADGWVLGNTQELGGTVSTLGIVLDGALPAADAAGAVAVLWRGGRRCASGRPGIAACEGLTPQMEYTATGFSKPIRMIFKALFRPAARGAAGV